MDTHDAHPAPAQAAQVEAFSDELYELLRARANSIGVIDVDVDTDGWHVDGELTFASGPDMGFTVDTAAGEARFCELVGSEQERWCDESRSGLRVLDAADDDVWRACALAVLDGVLAARRPLLRRDRDGGDQSTT